MAEPFSPADLLLPIIPGGPTVWDAPDELIERAMETHPRSPLIITDAAWEARQLIASRRWYLVRNEPMNEPARSTETGRKETYFTRLGVDRPWNGFHDLSVWLLKQMDPDNTQPTMAEVVEGLIGQWVDTGRIVEISEAKAKELSLTIKLKTGGREDIYGDSQRRYAERMAHDRRIRAERAALANGQEVAR